MFIIEDELKKLPARPGVYLMHDENDVIIYVGKAKSLTNRVHQYFQKSRNKGPKIEQMVTHIRRFEYIVTDSDTEALVLECNLIKEHHPKYNTMLMDDKTYPFIRVTTDEPYPRIQLARKIDYKKHKYFGPYPSAGAVKDIIDLLHKLYRIRNCNRNLPADIGKDRPCLYHHMEQCDAPCQGYINQVEYRAHVQEAIRFLNGNYHEVQEDLQKKMEAASEAMEFERAAEYRDLLQSVNQIAQKQKITDQTNTDRDIIAIATGENDAVAQAFFIRSGRMIGRDHYYLNIAPGDKLTTVMESFVKQFYSGTPYIPREIVLQAEPEDREAIEEWLSSLTGQKVHIRVPQKGSKEKLVELAYKNASMVLKQDGERLAREKARTGGAMQEIADLLGLSQVTRAEAYDISNTAGFESVGGMVVYENGVPKPSDYRKFRIKTIDGPDDYGSMKEVLTRRFSHGLEERQTGNGSSFVRFPDLIMMDGGKGQVHAAEEVLQGLGLDIPVCGMVKDDRHRTRGLYFRDMEIPISRTSEGFYLITRMQDEVHRFAITYHRGLRSKEQIHSILDDIPNIGETRRKALRKAYTGLEELKAATVEELYLIPGMNRRAAQSVYDFFHKEGK